MKYLKPSLVLVISFFAVLCASALFATQDTIVLQGNTKHAIDVAKSIDPETKTLIIAAITAVVNLVIHLFSRKNKKSK